MTRQNAEALIAWLLDTSAGIAYGTVSITITRHNAETRYIEKTVSEKEQVREGGAHG
jgi:hypothetical protein